MQWNSVTRISMVTIPIMMVCCLLVPASSMGPTARTPGSGTYTVNPNCTGSAVIIVPGNPLSPINLHFVVVKQGKEIHQVVDANVVTAVGDKVE